MPQPFNVQFAGGGQDVASVDQFGNVKFTGSLTAGSWIALPALAKAPVQVPGEAILWSPDGATINVVAPSGTGSLVAAPTASLAAPVTVTGTVAKTPLFTGPTITAAAGQIYRLVAWGQLTTTLAAQTVQFEVDWGATDIFTWSTQQPNSGGVVTGGSWKLEIDVQFQNATTTQASGWDGLNFFFSSLTQATTTVSTATPQALSLQLTNSATAVSVTCNGAYLERIA